MLTKIIEPGFYDTDALGHVNNTRLPVWFELARNDLFRLFDPGMDPRKWNLILAHLEVDYLDQIYFGRNVEVRTWIEKIGVSSITVLQEAYQGEASSPCARGRIVMVHFDYSAKKAVPVPDGLKSVLGAHFHPEA